MLDSNIADCEMLRGDLDAAREGYERALGVLVTRTPPDDPRRLYPRLGLGHVLVEQGELARGVTTCGGPRSCMRRCPTIRGCARWSTRSWAWRS